MSAQHTDINSIRPWRTITRRASRKIKVGGIEVGGDAPIAVQSMTNTLTHDVEATVAQTLARSWRIFISTISAASKPQTKARPAYGLIPAILADATA